MNKKARLYGISKLAQIIKIKDYHQKSFQKHLLNRSAERRTKFNPLQEQISERHQDPKIIQNKPKGVKFGKNIYNNDTNEKNYRGKEYSNTIGTIEKSEENNQITEKDFFKETENEEQNDQYNNRKNLSKLYNNDKNEKKFSKLKNNKMQINNEDEEDDNVKEKEDDLLYRTLYRTSKKNMNKTKEKEEKNKKNKEKDIKNQTYNEEKLFDNKLGITMEQTDILQYNKKDKKIHSNAYNSENKRRISGIKKSRPKYDYKDNNKTQSNNHSENEASYSPKTSEKKKIQNFYDLSKERTVDMFVIDDDDYDIKYLTKRKKKINRKNNKFREIIIENYGPNMPLKKDKFTGFVFIRKSKGKKMYKIELPDDIDKINEIFKNEEIMIKNQIIQIIPEQKMLSMNNQQSQNELKKSQNEKNLEKEIEKDKELIKDKERQITLLKNKMEELNNTIKKQTKQITQLEKDMKNTKLSSDQIKDSFQNLENENKSLKSQLQAYKMKRKSLQMQIEEESNHSLQEMKDRIQKYKNELRKQSVVEEKEKEYRRKSNVSNNNTQNINNTSEKNKNKNSNRNSIHSVGNQKKEELNQENKNDIDKKEEEGKNNDEEENYEDDYNYDMYDEKDPKARKMKKAMARFRKKYKDIIIENKKNIKLKEKEEKEKEEFEKRELEGNNSNLILKEKEEKEKKEKEKKEKEEQERKEKEEKEKKEKEERERKEKELKERERKEKEERERKERERKERERKEKEERERKEKERKEKEEKDKKEKDKKEKEKEKKVLPNKLMPNNFAKMLADKMKFAPMGGPGPKKSNVGIDNNIKPKVIIEKKVDVANLIEGQPFKRESKRKPTRKIFVD